MRRVTGPIRTCARCCSILRSGDDISDWCCSVHRNSGTSVFGRMDADELSAPGYAVLSAATRTKLATLEKGQLMIRHPHFTQPIFVRFPRPAVMAGRLGAE